MSRRKKRSRELKKDSDVIDFEEARSKRQEKREEEVRKKAEKHEQRSGRRGKKQLRRKLIYFAVIAVLFVTVGLSAWRVVSLKMEERKLLQEYSELQDEKSRLENELKTVNDPEYIEQQARKQLRLIMPGETLYVFSEDEE